MYLTPLRGMVTSLISDHHKYLSGPEHWKPYATLMVVSMKVCIMQKLYGGDSWEGDTHTPLDQQSAKMKDTASTECEILEHPNGKAFALHWRVIKLHF